MAPLMAAQPAHDARAETERLCGARGAQRSSRPRCHAFRWRLPEGRRAKAASAARAGLLVVGCLTTYVPCSLLLTSLRPLRARTRDGAPPRASTGAEGTLARPRRRAGRGRGGGGAPRAACAGLLAYRRQLDGAGRARRPCPPPLPRRPARQGRGGSGLPASGRGVHTCARRGACTRARWPASGRQRFLPSITASSATPQFSISHGPPPRRRSRRMTLHPWPWCSGTYYIRGEVVLSGSR